MLNMPDIVGKRFWYFLISGVLILIAVVSLVVFGLRSSIEFSSGSQLSIQFTSSLDYKALEDELGELGYGNAIVQSTGGNEYLIRTKTLTPEERDALIAGLSAKFGQLTQTGFNSISASTASKVTQNATIAVAVAMVGMLLYVTWAFRKMPNPFRWGTCFVIALFHDILVTVGLFSLLGHFLGWEINLMFITGILAIVGTSLDNTIVVFDRMRENQKLGVSPVFEMVVNRSQIETLGRSLNTTFTIVITCLALLIFIGGSIQNFVVVLLIGLIAGTYDSVFVAPGLLVVWNNKEWGRFVGRKPQNKLEPAAAVKGK
jgi:preprotein translocase subunit SecF